MRPIQAVIPQAVQSIVDRTEFIAVDIHHGGYPGSTPLSHLRQKAGKQIGVSIAERLPLELIDSAYDIRWDCGLERYRLQCVALTRAELTFLLASAYEAGRRVK